MSLVSSICQYNSSMVTINKRLRMVTFGREEEEVDGMARVGWAAVVVFCSG